MFVFFNHGYVKSANVTMSTLKLYISCSSDSSRLWSYSKTMKDLSTIYFPKSRPMVASTYYTTIETNVKNPTSLTNVNVIKHDVTLC